jgi:hypothetical protein
MSLENVKQFRENIDTLVKNLFDNRHDINDITEISRGLSGKFARVSISTGLLDDGPIKITITSDNELLSRYQHLKTQQSWIEEEISKIEEGSGKA